MGDQSIEWLETGVLSAVPVGQRLIYDYFSTHHFYFILNLSVRAKVDQYQVACTYPLEKMLGLLHSACFIFLSVPALSLPACGLQALSLPAWSFPALSLPTLSLPTLSLPAVTFSSIPTTKYVAQARILYQFPPGIFIENIAYRTNRKLLLSALRKPVLYELDLTAEFPSPKLAYDFTNIAASGAGMFGIAETNTQDVFAVAGGKWGSKNTFSVFTIDFRRGRTPDVRKVASIVETEGLNGLAVIQETNTVLVSDSKQGTVLAVNIASGQYHVAITDEAFKPADPTSPFAFGINGINVYKDKLYFTNSGRRSFGAVPIHQNGSRNGDVTVLAQLNTTKNYDDFAIDDDGNSIIATHPDTIYKISPKGDQSLLAVSDLIVQPTSSILGSAGVDKSTLFVSTGGNPPPAIPGGQIVVIENITSMPFTPIAPTTRMTPPHWSWQNVFLRQQTVVGQV